MSYLNQRRDPRQRAASALAVVAIHGAIGLVVVTGLTVVGLGPTEEKRVIGIPLTDPPPPAPTPSPTSEMPVMVPDPPAPMPPIMLPPQPGPTYQEFTDELVIPDVPRVPDPGPTFQPQPPRPSPSVTPARARPIGSPSAWISTDDYPRRPLVDEIEGVAGYRLIIGSNGRVSSCEVTSTSGNAQLDAATCKLLTRRARFEAASDETGAKIVGSYTGSVRWEIPD